MGLPVSRKSSRLPKRFPVGTTYVVEGRGGAEGRLRVFSRYVVLPGGRRIYVADDFGGSASPRARLARRKTGSPTTAKPQSARTKKNLPGAGTRRLGRH
jgi:hypothetical protein